MKNRFLVVLITVLLSFSTKSFTVIKPISLQKRIANKISFSASLPDIFSDENKRIICDYYLMFCMCQYRDGKTCSQWLNDFIGVNKNIYARADGDLHEVIKTSYGELTKDEIIIAYATIAFHSHTHNQGYEWLRNLPQEIQGVVKRLLCSFKTFAGR